MHSTQLSTNTKTQIAPLSRIKTYFSYHKHYNNYQKIAILILSKTTIKLQTLYSSKLSTRIISAYKHIRVNQHSIIINTHNTRGTRTKYTSQIIINLIITLYVFSRTLVPTVHKVHNLLNRQVYVTPISIFNNN